jgi:hypothetical protein
MAKLLTISDQQSGNLVLQKICLPDMILIYLVLW